MPRTSRRSRKPESDTVDEIDRDLAAAEAEAGVPGPETAPEESTPEPEVEPRAGRRGRGDDAGEDATIRVVASGPSKKVRRALAGMGGADQVRPEAEEEKEEDDDEVEDRFAELLQNPKHMVVVKREIPKNWKGVRCATKLDRYSCPTTLDRISEDVFRRFGGKIFMVTVHPNTSTGEARVIDSIMLENQDTDVPMVEGKPLVDEPEMEVEPDPFLEPDPDPMAQLDKTLSDQIKMVDRVMKLKGAKRVMKSLQDDDNEENGHDRRGSEDSARVRELEKRIEDMTIEQRMERRFEKLETLVTQVAELATSGGGKKGGGIDPMMQLFMQFMQSSDQKFQTLMTTVMGLLTSQNKKSDDLDTQLERLAKLKSALGDNNSKVKTIEEKLLNVAFERLLDGDAPAGDTVEDLGKVAIKEAAPLLKALIDKNAPGSQGAVQGPTQDQFKAAVKQQAQAVVEGLVKEWQAKGWLKIPDGAPAGALPAPKAETPAPAQPKKEESIVQPEDENTPPGPESPAYDRKRAVNFVLDTFIKEMKTQEENGYSVGDALDRLDEEILDGLLNVNSGADLDRLIGPYADPKKLEEIKVAGASSPRIQEWLSKIILSIKSAYRQELEEAQKTEQESANK